MYCATHSDIFFIWKILIMCWHFTVVLRKVFAQNTTSRGGCERRIKVVAQSITSKCHFKIWLREENYQCTLNFGKFRRKAKLFLVTSYFDTMGCSSILVTIWHFQRILVYWFLGWSHIKLIYMHVACQSQRKLSVNSVTNMWQIAYFWLIFVSVALIMWLSQVFGPSKLTLYNSLQLDTILIIDVRLCYLLPWGCWENFWLFFLGQIVSSKISHVKYHF